MDDIKRLQRQWLEASRRHHAPSEAAAQRMRRGLRARIEAGEPAPSVDPEPEAPAPAANMGPWLWGAGVLLAAAAALLLWVGQGSGTQLTRASEPNAASHDAKDRDAVQTARTRPQSVARASTEPTSETSASVAVEPPPAAPVPSSRARPRGSDSALEPSPRASAGGDEPVLVPSPSVDAASLDVAGEVAVLRRAKAAIEARHWARASGVLVEYEHSYPSGVLAPDARALRVLVDCHQRAANATVRATDFLQRNPSSSLRDRIRDACAIDRDH